MVINLICLNAGAHLPVVPVDPVAEALVFPLQVLAIKVGVVTGRVPPGALEPGGAVLAPGVVVAVYSGELGPLLGQTLSELPINTPVDDPEPKTRMRNDSQTLILIVTCKTLCR